MSDNHIYGEVSDDHFATFVNSSYSARPISTGDNSEMSDDKFATFTKNNYAARRTDYSPKVGSKGRVDSNRCVVISIAMLFLCVAILVLCVISSWIFFALEANNCKAAENAALVRTQSAIGY